MVYNPFEIDTASDLLPTLLFKRLKICGTKTTLQRYIYLNHGFILHLLVRRLTLQFTADLEICGFVFDETNLISYWFYHNVNRFAASSIFLYHVIFI